MVDLILVDSQNTPIGVKEKLQAHIDGDLHRAFSVIIFSDDNKKMLIHQRNKDKYHCGGLWTNACCSHPYPNETTIDAANRRLFEELGYKYLDLEEKFSFIYKAEFDNGLTEHEFDHIFYTNTNQDPPKLNPEEVDDFKWVLIEDLLDDIKKNPSIYTPWFKLILEKIYL